MLNEYLALLKVVVPERDIEGVEKIRNFLFYCRSFSTCDFYLFACNTLLEIKLVLLISGKIN